MTATNKTVLLSIHPFGKINQEPLALLQAAGFTVKVNPLGRKLTATELSEALQGVDAVIAGTEKFTSEVLGAAPQLQLISRVGVGIDSIDLATCTKQAIRIAITPDAPADAVAELSLGLMLDAYRQLSYADRHIRSGQWLRPTGRLIKGETIGLIGFGRIARRLAALLQPFAVKLLVYDPYISVSSCADYAIEQVELAELLQASDIVSLHTLLNESTQHLLNAETLSLMKKSAMLINTARGAIVDEDALYTALAAKQIRHACLDVFTEEPYQGPLIELENCTLISHAGTNTEQTRVAMELAAANAVIDFFTKKQLRHEVSL